MLTLRPYQTRAIDEMRAEYRRGARAVLYQGATGSGKTVIFCEVVRGAMRRGSRVWIVVHRQELLAQCSRALEALGIMHGLVSPGTSAGMEPVQVCSVQTLIRRLERGLMGGVELIVLDEAHHSTAGSWRAVIEARPDARLLGVTATPLRLDGQGLGRAYGGVFDSLVIGPSITSLIADGYLSPPVVYMPRQLLDMTGVRMRGGDYAVGETARRVDAPHITGDAVAHYRRICGGAPFLAYCASIKHAEHVAAEFRTAGFRVSCIDGRMGDSARRGLIDALGNNRMDGLTSCEIVSEGTDIPVVGAAILLRPTASLGLYLQQVGRALRPSPGKTRAVILDHVGNCARHGLPDDERAWGLSGAPAPDTDDAKAPPIRTCPRCFAAHRIAPVCPQCGFAYQPEGRIVAQEEGDLEEVTPEMAEQMRMERKRELGRAKTMDELLAVARKKNPDGDPEKARRWAQYVIEHRRKAAQRHVDAWRQQRMGAS
jgi:superfamily II DNA or RNA helicase